MDSWLRALIPAEEFKDLVWSSRQESGKQRILSTANSLLQQEI